MCLALGAGIYFLYIRCLIRRDKGKKRNHAVSEQRKTNYSLQFDLLHHRIFHGVYFAVRICHLDLDVYFDKNIYPDKIGRSGNHFFRYLHDGFHSTPFFI